MALRYSNVAFISSIAAIFTACGAKTLNVGDSSPTSGNKSEIKYTGGCTPDQCANQGAGCVGGTSELTCAPDPNAGTGSLPAGSCRLMATCTTPDAGSSAIASAGGCTLDKCSNDPSSACAPEEIARSSGKL